MTMILSKVEIVEKLASTEWENRFQYVLRLKRGGFSDGQISEMLLNRGMSMDQAEMIINSFHSQLEMEWASRLIKQQAKLFLLFSGTGFLTTSLLRLYDFTGEVFLIGAGATLGVVGLMEIKRYFE